MISGHIKSNGRTSDTPPRSSWVIIRGDTKLLLKKKFKNFLCAKSYFSFCRQIFAEENKLFPKIRK